MSHQEGLTSRKILEEFFQRSLLTPLGGVESRIGLTVEGMLL